MKKCSSEALRRRRETLIRELPPIRSIVRGSLIERYKRCGKSGCHCADERGHGPKYYLSVSKPKTRPQMDYVPVTQLEQVQAFLDNYRRLRVILEEICDINRELFRRKEPL